ncbi:MAG TPA: hypothetical protein VJV79_33195, partial [Polyangiaceae bacterium]|nr:hypothetical protein [Polyangiaceae bacterium]
TPAFAGAVALAGFVRDLAMAPDGAFYVVGLFEKTIDFDPGAGVDLQTAAGGVDSFVTRFAADGSYLWTRTIGGALGFVGLTVAAVAPDGMLFLAGDYAGPVDLDPGAGTDIAPNAMPGFGGGFVAKWDPAGTLVAVVRFPGGPDAGSMQFNDMALGENGEILSAGAIQGKVDLHLPLGDGTVTIPSGQIDGFALSLGPDLRTLWGFEFPHVNFLDVSAGAAGSVWIAGQFDGVVDFDPSTGTNIQTSAGEKDAILLHVGASGEVLAATPAGGTGHDTLSSVSYAPDGSVYLLGSLSPGGFQIAGLAPSGTANGSDLFFARLGADGRPIWVDLLGGPSSEFPGHVLATEDGVLALGSAESPNVAFDRAGGLTWAGTTNAGFITRRRADGSHVFTMGLGGAAYLVPLHVAMSASSMVVAGIYNGTPDLDPGPGTASLPTAESAHWLARFQL